MFFAVKDRLRRKCFALRTSGLSESPPARVGIENGVHVLSQLQHKDLLLYLAAIKSFALRVPISRVTVLDDGSLTEEDRRQLNRQVDRVDIRSIAEFQDPQLPRGGTWERLTAIAYFSMSDYVIQLDADTLSLGELPEVIAAIRGNQSFTIGTWDEQGIERANERSAEAEKVLARGANHVQIRAEAAISGVGDGEKLRYVRGCSGFAGFAPSEGKLRFMRSLSASLEGKLGSVWRQWGSEQVMSNLLVANQEEAIVLPHPAYCDCSKVRLGVTRFIHFIGQCRFDRGQYAEMIRGLGLCKGGVGK